jgi:hypothetical protein
VLSENFLEEGDGPLMGVDRILQPPRRPQRERLYPELRLVQ